jgi:hypothetical protein
MKFEILNPNESLIFRQHPLQFYRDSNETDLKSKKTVKEMKDIKRTSQATKGFKVNVSNEETELWKRAPDGRMRLSYMLSLAVRKSDEGEENQQAAHT